MTTAGVTADDLRVVAALLLLALVAVAWWYDVVRRGK
jgi:glucose-6-phosphate dehydrogenase assembly protein OpcA